ncbi:MAG: tetratricopeptide repeat protein [Luteolibacter sp.]
MPDRIAKTLRLPTARLAASVMLWFAVTPAGAQTPAPISPAQFDPSDVYFQGYLSARAAEQLEASGDFVAAAEKLEKARKLFEAVRRYYPDWKTEMVTGRSAQNSEAEVRVHPKAEEQRKKNRSVVAELEGGVKQSGTLIDPAQGVVPLTPGILEVDPLATRRLAEAEAEVKRLRDLTNSTAQNSATREAEASRDSSRVRDIARQRDLLQSQLNAAEAQVQSLRARLATSPVENEMKSLNQRIAGLEQEREAMAMALTQSRSANTEALARNAILEADLKVMQQKRADLDRDLKVERNVASSVVAGQRTQLQALEKELAKKSDELGKANLRIGDLENELKESRDAYTQLRSEHESLLHEREQMSALLKLNEDGRIQDLVQQNIGLAKNLREANEKVERLNIDNNSAKDDIIDALRDLAIAKSQINKLHQERRDQDQRLADLEQRLKSEESALTKGQVAADPAEVAVLRDIIQRQLRVQERRRQARDLLIEAVKDMGSKDERIAQAIELFDGQEIQLSPDEQRLIANNQVDGEFISPFAQDRATVGRNTTELHRDIAVFERTAEKSFAAGRFLPTRELFQMIVEQHPGHIPALCKLGVVNLKLQDPTAAVDTFQRAVELDANNPYAYRMLGYSHMSLGDMAAAEINFRRAVDLAPQDAKSQFLIGSVCYRLGRRAEAESHFKASITADPIPSEPYYNLALISSRSNRLDRAREFYHQALERGAVPDPKLERLLNQQP